MVLPPEDDTDNLKKPQHPDLPDHVADCANYDIPTFRLSAQSSPKLENMDSTKVRQLNTYTPHHTLNRNNRVRGSKILRSSEKREPGGDLNPTYLSLVSRKLSKDLDKSDTRQFAENLQVNLTELVGGQYSNVTADGTYSNLPSSVQSGGRCAQGLCVDLNPPQGTDSTRRPTQTYLNMPQKNIDSECSRDDDGHAMSKDCWTGGSHSDMLGKDTTGETDKTGFVRQFLDTRSASQDADPPSCQSKSSCSEAPVRGQRPDRLQMSQVTEEHIHSGGSSPQSPSFANENYFSGHFFKEKH